MSGGERAGVETMGDDEIDERVEHMAKAIYEAYGVLIGEPAAYQWDAALGSEYTTTKFRSIADDALDKIEWMKFGLAPKEVAID